MLCIPRLVRDSTPFDICATLPSDATVSYVSIKGNTVYLLCNNNEIWELGQMKFVLQYLRNAQKIYTSGGFVPKDAKPENIVRANLTESISLLDDTASFFCALTETKQAIAQGKDVRGAHGTVYHVTTGCLAKTRMGLDLVKKRIELLGCRNIVSCKPYTLLNETGIEHSFGRSTIQNGTYNKTLRDYVSQKMKSEEDFFFKICKIPFSNPSTYRKRYADPVKVDLDIGVVLNILKNSKHLQKDAYTLRSSADCDDVLTEAERIARSQPRRTNRSKWKETAGFKPLMLVAAPNKPVIHGFMKNDVVAVFDSITSNVKFLFVNDNYTLNDIYLFESINGCPMDQWGPEDNTDFIVRLSITMFVNTKTLLKDKGDCYFVFNHPLPNSTDRIRMPISYLKAIEERIFQIAEEE